jgi:hypothetical protein
MRVDSAVLIRNAIAAVEHRQDVADLIAKVGRHRFRLCQDRHLRAQSRIAHQCADVERRWHDHTADVAPLRREVRLRCARLVRVPAPMTGASNAEIDAARVKHVEHAEALGHRDRGGLAELHGGGADADPLGGGGDLTDQHRGR